MNSSEKYHWWWIDVVPLDDWFFVREYSGNMSKVNSMQGCLFVVRPLDTTEVR